MQINKPVTTKPTKSTEPTNTNLPKESELNKTNGETTKSAAEPKTMNINTTNATNTTKESSIVQPTIRTENTPIAVPTPTAPTPPVTTTTTTVIKPVASVATPTTGLIVNPGLTPSIQQPHQNIQMQPAGKTIYPGLANISTDTPATAPMMVPASAPLHYPGAYPTQFHYVQAPGQMGNVNGQPAQFYSPPTYYTAGPSPQQPVVYYYYPNAVPTASGGPIPTPGGLMSPQLQFCAPNQHIQPAPMQFMHPSALMTPPQNIMYMPHTQQLPRPSQS